MKVEILDSRLRERRFERLLHIFKPAPLVIGKDIGRINPPDHLLEGRPHGLVDRNFSPFSVLRLVEKNKPMLEVDVFIPFKKKDFFFFHPGSDLLLQPWPITYIIEDFSYANS